MINCYPKLVRVSRILSRNLRRALTRALDLHDHHRCIVLEVLVQRFDLLQYSLADRSGFEVPNLTQLDLKSAAFD